MSDHYLLVDHARRRYFDCEKLLILGGEQPGEPDALHEQPFERWWRLINWGDDPPDKTDRYRLALPEAKAVYAFLVDSGWTACIVQLDNDLYDVVVGEEGHVGYERVGTIWPWHEKGSKS